MAYAHQFPPALHAMLNQLGKPPGPPTRPPRSSMGGKPIGSRLKPPPGFGGKPSASPLGGFRKPPPWVGPPY